MKVWRAIGFSLIASLSSGSLARAQDASPSTAVLPPVVVPLPPEDSAATETPSRREPTGALSVIPVDQRRAEASVASEVIASAPGIVLQDRGGLLQSKTLSLRGASSNGVLVLMDGVPLNGAGGSVDLSRLPLALVDHIEVLRGSGSSYGNGAMGGVVNVVTRAPKQHAVITGGLTVGSFATALGNLSATGALLGGTGLVIVHGEKSNGAFPYQFDPTPLTPDTDAQTRTRQNNDVTMGGALLRYRRAFTDSTHLDASAEFSLDDRGLAGTAANPTPIARMHEQRFIGSARIVHTLESGGELSARGYAIDDALGLSQMLDATGQSLLSAGVDLDGRWLIAERHGLSASARVGYEGLSTGEGDSPSWFKGGAAISDELLLLDGDLSVVPSLRVDQTGPFTTFSPKLGASYTLPNGFSIRANAGQANRAPSFLELYVVQGTMLPNPDLKPERALFADLGVAHDTSWSTVRLTGFYSLYENLIAYEYYPPFLARPYNFSAAVVDGVEAEASVRPSEHFEASASYTFTHSQNLRDDPRFYLKPLPYRPQHRVFARASGGVEWARVHGELDLQSEQFTNRTGSRSLPARAFVNAGVTSRVWRKPELRLSFDVKNVLDVQSQDFDGYPLPGRAFFVSVSFSLGDVG